MTYNRLNTLLQGRCQHQRKIANNTWAIRRADCIAIRLHSTDILSFYPDGAVRYQTNGWTTSTTKQRMNAYGPAFIHQHRFQWYITWAGQVEEYYDGITLNTASEPLAS